MIYYLSGTGNSLYVARLLAGLTDDDFCSITSPKQTTDSIIGLVFPIYAWGVPGLMREFIEAKLTTLLPQGVEYVYAVMTCGTDMGYADKLLRKLLSRQGLTLNAVFTVIMPNTYVAFPGFKVDSQEVVNKKMSDVPAKTRHVADCINGRRDAAEVRRGPIPFTYTYIIRPLFNAFLLNDNGLKVEHNKCILCGMCVRQCPVGNIYMRQGTVGFIKDDRSTGCAECFHVSPKNAIQWGRITKGKAQKKVYT